MLFPIRQRYIFESKSQHLIVKPELFHLLFPIRQRYIFESKSQQYCDHSQRYGSCFQYDKDTFLKANHNSTATIVKDTAVVSNTTKIHFWKQITTLLISIVLVLLLFPIRQRYIFESKSQLIYPQYIEDRCCFQYDKDTFLKANHNK